MVWIIEKTQGYIFRKIIHILLNGSLAYLAFFLEPQKLFPIALGIFLVITVAEIARIHTPALNGVNYAIEPMLKRKEKKKFTGVFWGAAGALAVSPFVTPQVMSFALAVFAVSDPAAALVGKYTKSKRIYHRKTVNGSAAFFLTALLSSSAFIYFLQVPSTPFLLILAFAAFLTLLEFICDPLDDNFVIIIFAAVFAHVIL